MEIITIEKTAFKTLVEKIDRVHEELLRLQNPVKQMSSQWVDTNDVLRILNISRRTLSKYLSQGKLPYTRLENKNFFRLSDVEAFLASGYGFHQTLNS